MKRLAAEDGSIPLVLIVTILVGGLVAALVSTVIVTQRSVTFDRNYTQAVTVADAGLQQALVHLSQQSGTESIGTTITSDQLQANQPAANDDLGEGQFYWEAVKSGPIAWEVRSEGTLRDETRAVESTITADSDFFLAAFSDLGITFRGGNGADSYPDGGFGALGSNNAIVMNGNSYADLFFLYGANATCSGCDTGSTTGSDTELDMEALRVRVREQQDTCTDGFSSWTASVEGDPDGDGVAQLNAGDVICATDVEFDIDVTITGADQDTPVKVIATGDINSNNGLYVNCEQCKSTTNPENAQPPSGALQIFSSGPSFTLGNHNFFAAAVLAPDASCTGGGNGEGGGGSNAQTDFYGSLICQDIGNQGGWNFHYDEDLLRIGSGKLDIAAYREETSTTSSFTWGP